MRNRLFLAALAILFIAMLLLASRATTFAGAGSGTIPPPAPITCTWESGGPTLSGIPLHTNSVDASPSYASDRTLYAATIDDLQMSSNGGQTWNVIFAQPAGSPPTAYFSHVRATPAGSVEASPLTLFAILYAPATTTSTIYRSDDAGATWQPVATLAGAGLPRALAVSPGYADDQTVFAIFGEGLALHKSVNGGQTWNTYPFGPLVEYFNGFDLAISPTYASDQTLYAAGFGPLHRSTDGGANWSSLATLNPTFDVAVSPQFATDRRVWSTFRTIEAVGDGTPEAGVQSSADGGGAWTLGAVGLPGVYEPNPRFLSVSPRFDVDQSVFTMLKGDGSSGAEATLFRSFDGGTVWADQFAPPNSLTVSDAVATYASAEGVRIHLATSTGVWSYSRLCAQHLINPGFETDWAWALDGQPDYAAYSSEVVYAGQRALKLGIVAPTPNAAVTATAQQTVTLPANVAGITLALWLLPQTTETPLAPEVNGQTVPQPDGDYQFVRLYTGARTEPITLWQGRATSPTWLQHTFDLAPYAGQTVRIEVGVYNDGINGITALFADNVTVNVGLRGPAYRYMPVIFRQEVTPTPTPTATPTALPHLMATVNLGAQARGVAVSADGLRGYVGLTADDGRGEIGVLTLQPLALTQSIPLGPNSSSLNDVALNEEGRLLFAAEREAGALAVVNVLSGTLVQRLPVGALPNGVAVQRGVGYVANFGSSSVTFFNPTTGVISGTLTNAGSEPSLFAVETGLATDAQRTAGCCTAGSKVFMSLHGADQVVTFAGAAPIGARSGLDNAYGLAYDPAGRQLYVANRGPAHEVSVVDVVANQIVGTIDTADKEPYVLAVNPNTGHLFVVCDNQARIYRTSDLGYIKTITLAAGYNSRIAVDPVLDRVYITDYDSRTLSVIQDGG